MSRRGARRRRLAVSVVVVVVGTGAGAAWWTLAGDRGTRGDRAAAQEQGAAADTAAVTRGDLTTDHDLTGEVAYGEPWTLPLQPGGVVTAAHPVGTVVDFGLVLVQVDGLPVILAEGAVPMHRELALSSPRTTGPDVEQLQQFLRSAGFDDGGRLEVDGEYGPATRDALKDWQASVGLPDTGRVDGSQLVFSPTPLRIAATPRTGTAFDELQVSDPDAVVTVEISAAERSGLPVGGEVRVELGDGTTLAGVVDGQERYVDANGAAAWRVTIDVDGELGTEGATVAVHSTVVDAADVLIVPTSALLAVAEGGFAVEVVEETGTRLVRVDVGTVVDGRAEIEGAVEPGDEVVVP